ncbi:transcriptional regulator, partial [Paenibacillus sepulcri]|nr:transcriptional regulator [Paenibacillus sepulcri]
MKYLFHPVPEDIQLSSVLNALSDPIRLNLAKELSIYGEMACGGLSAPVVKSTLSHHVRTLR